MNIVDRRRNPKQKSIGNRQRFLRRVRSQVKRAVNDAIKNKSIADVGQDGSISIPAGGDLSEPSFHLDGVSGKRKYVLPGNQDYQRGDRIRKPESDQGQGSGGSADGQGEDGFRFLLRRDEFLDLLFEDLRLPDLVKQKLGGVELLKRTRAGFSSEGAPTQLNLTQTMRRSLARRIAMGRPKRDDLESLLDSLEVAKQEKDEEKIQEIEEALNRLQRRMRIIPYLDEVDLRFNHYEPRPKPATAAVMFCLMDTSASMTEDLKMLAKRFFILLHLFLRRHYQNVEIVFIRHTFSASEVDEETFFYGQETGGTVVSSALSEMMRIIKSRYPVSDWNIYAAQASDGHNFDHDMPLTMGLLQKQVLPCCQYYAYLEVFEEPFYGHSLLWESYEELAEKIDHLQCARVSDVAEIYPVFHGLFTSGATT